MMRYIKHIKKYESFEPEEEWEYDENEYLKIREMVDGEIYVFDYKEGNIVFIFKSSRYTKEGIYRIRYYLAMEFFRDRNNEITNYRSKNSSFHFKENTDDKLRYPTEEEIDMMIRFKKK